MRVPDDWAVADAMLRRPKTLPATATVDDVRRVFESRKVIVALLIGDDGRLASVIARPEVGDDLPGESPALALGALLGRCVSPDSTVAEARARLDASDVRRLAVTDAQGRLLGLLCLNRRGTGYCSDDDVDARARERAAAASHPVP